MADKLIGEVSPLDIIAANKANKDLGDKKGLLSSDAGTLILSKYEESEINRDNSFRDPLTGLLNRRGVIEEYKLVIAERERIGATEGVGLVALDVIGLKRLNLEHTPEGADKIIKNAADSLKGLIRKSDLACRWGGDEFVLILFGTDKVNVIKIIDEINNRLPEHVRYNIGYEVANSSVDPDVEVRKVMDKMEKVKKLGALDATGRATGNGISIDINDLDTNV